MTSRPPPAVAIYLPSFNVGGAEIVAVELANALSELGWKTYLVVMSTDGKLKDRIAPSVEIVGLASANYRSAIGDLADFFDARRPDIILSTLYANNIVCILARMRSAHKPRVIAGAHNSLRFKISHPDNLKDRWLLYPLSLAVMRYADLTIAVSRGVADELRTMLRLDPARVKVVYNPVYKPELLALAGQASGHPWLEPSAGAETEKGPATGTPRPPVIVTVGRLIEQKGHIDLLDAVARLNAMRPVRLLVIGDGPLRASLERHAADLSLTGVVQFLGHQDNPFKFLARADLFVLSSWWEGLANVVIEALACGCPVVATDCNFGPREILDGERFGLLAKVRSPDDLAARIAQSLDEPATSPRKDKAALLGRAQLFSRINSVDGYREIFEALVAN